MQLTKTMEKKIIQKFFENTDILHRSLLFYAHLNAKKMNSFKINRG